MPGRVVELSKGGLAVHKRRGFLAVDDGGREVGRVAFDDISVVMASHSGLMWSNSALAELSGQQIPVMIIAEDFRPTAVVLPLDGHHAQAVRFRAQASASAPFRKQAWAEIVRRKIQAQAEAVALLGMRSARLEALHKSVRSGDTANTEGQAASLYWPLIMGRGFRRDREATGANALLNYGYTVLRAATARAIVASGLHPSLSLHHTSGGDALALADDLMEPFRPTIDLVVRDLLCAGIDNVPSARSRLVECLSADFTTKHGRTSMVGALTYLCQSLAQSYLNGKVDLSFPTKPLPASDGDSDD